MEVKINKDIKKFKATVFFGLTVRQGVFAAIAVVVTAAAFFWLAPVIGEQGASWLCILVAFPCIAIGFVTYNGMPFERVAWVWLRYQLLEPRQLRVKFQNHYAPLFEPELSAARAESLKSHPKNERTEPDEPDEPSENPEQEAEAAEGTV